MTGIERLTTALYNRAAYLLDRHTPETIKAGMVSDYGVPEAVIDQRAMMQGRQRVQLRQAGSLVEKLATLTRAESRVAYEWMNETDPHTIYTMMHNLPEESVKVLMEVQGMIDKSKLVSAWPSSTGKWPRHGGRKRCADLNRIRAGTEQYDEI